MVERIAKLFEAGRYDDKNIEITENDIDQMISSFAEAPVKVEHVETPFDGAIGSLKKIWRKGSELFGKIAFTPEAWAFIDSANARKLSVAIKRDKSAISEVSLVKNPRIAGAAVFDDKIEITTGEIVLKKTAKFTEEELAEKLADNAQAIEVRFNEKLSSLEAENKRLVFNELQKNAQLKIDELKNLGKITPASEQFAKAILINGNDAVVTFNSETESYSATIAELFVKFVESLPKQVEFSELGCVLESKIPEFSAEQAAFFAKLGVKPEEAVKYLKVGN